MKTSLTGLATLLVLTAFGGHQVSGHGFLVQPLVEFVIPDIDQTQYSATIEAYALFPDGNLNQGDFDRLDFTLNVKSFVENYKKSKYKSIRKMIEENQVLVSNDAMATLRLHVA